MKTTEIRKEEKIKGDDLSMKNYFHFSPTAEVDF